MEGFSPAFPIGNLSYSEVPLGGDEDHVKWANQILEDGWTEWEKANVNNIGETEIQMEGFVSGLAMEEGNAMNHAGTSSQQKEKNVVRWTEDEHKAFLVGLEAYGKGSWSTISKVLVPTKTTSQVASHAQKYLRRVRSKTPTQKRRSSIHDTRILNSGEIIQVCPRLVPPPVPVPVVGDVPYSSSAPNYHVPYNSGYPNFQASSSSMHTGIPNTFPCMEEPQAQPIDGFTEQQRMDFMYMLAPFSPASYDNYN